MAIDQRNKNAPKTDDGAKQIADTLTQTAEVSQRAADAMTGNVQAVAEAGGILAHGLQKIFSEWLDLAQSRFQMNLDGASKLLACKTPQEVVATQGDLVRQNMERMLGNSCRIAEMSIEIGNEAADKIKATRETAEHVRLHRAA
jgi:phasin family protein